MPKKVPQSEFLSSKRLQLKKLIEKLGETFSYASVLGTDVVSKRYVVSGKVTSISDGTWGERGFAVRVYRDGRYYEYAFNEMPDGESGAAVIA